MASGVTTRLTYEDFFKLPDDARLVELIEGELYWNPTPPIRHQAIIGNLVLDLAAHLERHGGGEVWLSPLDVILDNENVCEPDVMIVSDARASIVGERCITGAPDLLIEVLTEESREKDEVTKRRIYERSGVLEYWIVDPERTEVKICRDGDVIRIETGGTITSPLLPELALDLRDVFRK